MTVGRLWEAFQLRFGGSFRICCGVLCCPPLPRSVITKLIFMPSEPTYSLEVRGPEAGKGAEPTYNIRVENEDNTHWEKWVEMSTGISKSGQWK